MSCLRGLLHHKRRIFEQLQAKVPTCRVAHLSG